ncbi:SDR family mycofactocin-dependent oxidoreductase [Mycolicibacterium duvalii]|uniref:mycofactocin-coupled SDR family oxidoreductase n=1 Tax=Mycolicibacterium duvalii TaxID=39688 RepID=UPI000BEEA693|nr:mycofactocin-coupled SDR family oxidoreductase [Mycolicibacterium duvalii]MCV7370016.1 mycofactocin-coupled SDR family oxidoreductase [Mycolicibacterium duvalii]PEG40760.1 SDR family mycofactocin-dependent oxidoreductase [Mycolicibacterium duvalii]
MTGRVEGKVAFITGAARGQGRSHAIKLAEEGADIIAIDVCKNVDHVQLELASPGDLLETKERVEALGRRIVIDEVDVRDLDALQRVVDRGVAELGRLDIILANAGIGNGGQTVEAIDEAVWQTMMDINLTGVWKTVKVGIPHIVAGGRGGSIVLTSSVAGLKAYPQMSQYVSAKHGVVGLMRSCAVELAPHMIRVNSVHPTHVNSPMVMNDETFRMFRPDLENPGPDDIAPLCQMFHSMPRPWVEIEDITNAVLFFASDESRYVTGVSMPIDLGSCLK